MPHLTLEYSANVELPDDPSGLFQQFHDVLHNTGGISMGNCKSRARIADPFYVAAGEADGAFIHLDVRFMEGRTEAVRQAIGKELLEILHDAFSEARASLDLQITVKVGEILRTAYNKYPEGTLSKPPN